MKQIIVISLLVAVCFFSCSRCNEDLRFKAQFENCINVLEKTYGKGYIASSKDRYMATLCLMLITGSENHMFDSSDMPFFYPSGEVLDEDIAYWHKWYDKHKCSYTLEIAEKLLKEYDKELTWPINADSLDCAEGIVRGNSSDPMFEIGN